MYLKSLTLPSILIINLIAFSYGLPVIVEEVNEASEIGNNVELKLHQCILNCELVFDSKMTINTCADTCVCNNYCSMFEDEWNFNHCHPVCMKAQPFQSREGYWRQLINDAINMEAVA